MFNFIHCCQRARALGGLLVMLCLIILCRPAAAQLADPWTGAHCLAKNPEAAVHQGERVVGTARQLDPIFRVSESRAGWLGVRSALVEGWIAENDAVRLDQAVEYFSDRIARNRADVAAYTGRGIAWRALGQYQRAMDDHNQALEVDPRWAAAYANRGNAYAHLGRHDLALADYDQAIRLDPELLAAHNNLAWSLATRPESELRDGRRAVASATKACSLTHWANPECLDTLAAAYAEAGDFDQALHWENQALKLSTPETEQTAAFASRLALYRTRQPYRHRTGNLTPAANVSR